MMKDEMPLEIAIGNNAFIYQKEALYHLMYGFKIEFHDKNPITLNQVYKLSVPERIFIRGKDTSKVIEVNPEKIIKEFKEKVILHSYGKIIGIMQHGEYDIEKDTDNLKRFMHVYFKIRKGETWDNTEILDNMSEDDLKKFEDDKAREYINSTQMELNEFMY